MIISVQPKHQAKLPEASPVLDLIEAFRRSKTMFVALSVGIFDRLETGGKTAAALAYDLACDASALERLLEGCVGLGVLAVEDGVFRNTETASVYLTERSPHSLAGYIRYSDSILYPMWTHLEDAVREGRNRWQQTFQLSSSALFDSFYSTDEALRSFLLGMHGLGMLSSPAVVAGFDLSPFERAVDLGGATGHLVMTACERYPRLQGVLFDLPRPVGFAREMLKGSPAGQRIECVAGNFFVDPLPPGDLYLLGRILHDWTEEKIGYLLAKVRQRLPAGGAVLIAEKLLDADHRGPVCVHMQSLNMLVCTEGRERSFGEYRALLSDAGFRNVRAVRTGQPVDAVLAWK